MTLPKTVMLKQQTGSFSVQEHKDNFEGTYDRGTFKGTIFWSVDMGKVIEAIGIWEDSPLSVSIRDLRVDEAANRSGRIYRLFY